MEVSFLFYTYFTFRRYIFKQNEFKVVGGGYQSVEELGLLDFIKITMKSWCICMCIYNALLSIFLAMKQFILNLKSFNIELYRLQQSYWTN